MSPASTCIFFQLNHHLITNHISVISLLPAALLFLSPAIASLNLLHSRNHLLLVSTLYIDIREVVGSYNSFLVSIFALTLIAEDKNVNLHVAYEKMS